MPKWEYLTVVKPTGTTKDEDLNELGHQQWELVDVEHSDHLDTFRFKRPEKVN